MMETVIDTNVLMSGLIWGGYPGQIMSSFGDSVLNIAVTKAIISEYLGVAERLEKKYPNTQVLALVNKLLVSARVYTPVKLRKSISCDPDDDKFIACALAAKANVIISGDSDLLTISGYEQIEVLKPRTFVERYLR